MHGYKISLNFQLSFFLGGGGEMENKEKRTVHRMLF